MKGNKISVYFIFTLMFILSTIMGFYSVGKSYVENTSLYLGEYSVTITLEMFLTQYIIMLGMYVFIMIMVKLTPEK